MGRIPIKNSIIAANTDLPDSQNLVRPPKMTNANAIESPASNTSILDLNDDCLREVFERFSLDDLCAVADTCSRFKGIAQESFKTLKQKKLEFRKGYPIPYEQQLKQFSKVLRNFGAWIEEIHSSEIESLQCRNRFLELVSLYCSEKLTKLQLCFPYENMTEEFVYRIRPSLRHLEKLQLSCYTFEQLFLEVLPVWSPNLRELQLYCDPYVKVIQGTLGLRQNYPKLERVTFIDVKFDDIMEFLKWNPQLKEFSQSGTYHGTEPQTRGLIFQCIASYTPNIVKLKIGVSSMTKELDRKYIKCLSQLSALKSLHIFTLNYRSLYFPLSEIDFASVPLDDLKLDNWDLRGEAIEITKLKKLKSLTLMSIKGLTVSHIIDICKQCTELSLLRLGTTLFGNDGLTSDNLLEIIQNGQELRTLQHRELARSRFFDPVYATINMDVDLYKKIANMVQNRAHKLSLVIQTKNEPQIPKQIVESHKRTFELEFLN